MIEMEALKIAVVSSTLWPARRAYVYGSEVEAFLLAEQLGMMGHEIRFYGASGSEKSRYFRSFHYLPHTQTLSYEIENYVVDHFSHELMDADVIIDMSAIMAVSEWAHFFGRIPYIATRNGTDLTHPRITGTRNLVVLSQKVLDVNPGVQAKIIPYGIDQDMYVPVQDPTRDYWLYVSRPHPSKGTETFLRIAKRMPDQAFRMMFPMVSQEQKDIGSRIISTLPPNVEYVPGGDDFDGKKKIGLYQNAKALIIPLDSGYVEGFGLVFAECMATGTPIMTNAMSIDNSQWPGTDLLAPHKSDPEAAYIHAMQSFIQPEPGYVRQWILNRYTKQAFARQYEELAVRVVGISEGTGGDRW